MKSRVPATVRPHLVIAGTDTNVGKTVVSAALAAALGAAYWKPIQSGLAGETDSQTVSRLGRLPADRILRSVHSLALPASPHIAARREGVEIRQRQLVIPDTPGPLVIETAGGLMVPLSPRLLQIDVIADWQLPVVLVARTALGTINHTLLSLEALRRRRVPVQGVAFVGGPQPEVEATIVAMGRVRRLGRLPRIRRLDADKLAAAFAKNFEIGAFVE
jgi:dethiobiotin synthetase